MKCISYRDDKLPGRGLRDFIKLEYTKKTIIADVVTCPLLINEVKFKRCKDPKGKKAYEFNSYNI